MRGGLRHPRSAIAVVMLSVQSVVLVPSAAPAETSRVHAIVGTTTFSARETSVTRIRFPHPLATDDVHFHVKGNGRIYGFIMRRMGDYERGFGPSWSGRTIGLCATRGCRSKDQYVFQTSNDLGTVLSGTWELVVIADVALVKVKLKVKGSPGGDAPIPVDGRVRSEIRSLTTRIHEETTDTVYSAGDFSRFPDPYFGATGLWLMGDPHVATGWGHCAYFAPPPHSGSLIGLPRPPAEYAFMPGCPTGSRSIDVHSTSLGGPSGLVASMSAYDGLHGAGGWFTSVSEVNRFGAVGFWIDFCSKEQLTLGCW